MSITIKAAILLSSLIFVHACANEKPASQDRQIEQQASWVDPAPKIDKTSAESLQTNKATALPSLKTIPTMNLAALKKTDNSEAVEGFVLTSTNLLFGKYSCVEASQYQISKDRLFASQADCDAVAAKRNLNVKTNNCSKTVVDSNCD